MGAGFRYSCSNCEFSIIAETENIYVCDDAGERHICPYPNESETMYAVFSNSKEWQVLTDKVEKKAFELSRTGTSCQHICKACEHLWDQNPKRDARNCPKCGSVKMSTVWDLKDKNCPKCEEGTIISDLEPDWVS